MFKEKVTDFTVCVHIVTDITVIGSKRKSLGCNCYALTEDVTVNVLTEEVTAISVSVLCVVRGVAVMSLCCLLCMLV